MGEKPVTRTNKGIPQPLRRTKVIFLDGITYRFDTKNETLLVRNFRYSTLRPPVKPKVVSIQLL